MSRPTFLFLDHNSSFLYLSDTGNHKIKKIDLATYITQDVAGIGSAGYADAAAGDALLTAQFDSPHGIQLDENGVLWIADK